MMMNLAENRDVGDEAVGEAWCTGGTDRKSATLSWRWWSCSGSGSSWPWPTNSPETMSGDPNTSSAGDVPRSSFGMVLRPSMTQGNQKSMMMIDSKLGGMPSCFDGTSLQDHLPGMVSHSPIQFSSKEVREFLPELGHELGSSVRRHIGGKAIMSNPTTEEGISHIFDIYATQRNCFWPASDSVHHCEEVGETLGGREWETGMRKTSAPVSMRKELGEALFWIWRSLVVVAPASMVTGDQRWHFHWQCLR